MARLHREDILFLALSSVTFLVICAITYVVRMRVIYWFIGNCRDAAGCVAADIFITYWWALFVPALLLSAYLLNRIYQARLIKRKEIQA